MLEGILISIASYVASKGFEAFFKNDSNVVQRAIESTSRRFPDIEGAETSLKR